VVARNPFDDEWRACLEAHLRYVITVGDTNNEKSLSEILLTTGFSDHDLYSLRHELLGAVAEQVVVEAEVEMVTEQPAVAAVETDVDAETELRLVEDNTSAEAQGVLTVEDNVAPVVPNLEKLDKPAKPPAQQLSLF
jgi:hypothetical protein